MLIYYSLSQDISLNRYFKTIRRKRDCSERFLLQGQKMFIYALLKYLKMKRNRVGKCYAFSLYITIVSHYIITITLFMKTFNPFLRNWLFIIMIFQMIFILIPIFFVRFLIKHLYRSSSLIFHNVVRNNSESLFQSPINQLRLNNFLEVYHTRNKFSFKLGIFGKISSYMIAKFLIMYTTYFMTMFSL